MNELGEHKLKVTNQRMLVLETIKQLGTNASIDNIIRLLPNINKSTIYRILSIFLEDDIIEKSIVGNEVIYLIKKLHNHYMTCIKCKKIVKLKECHFEQIKGILEKENDITLIDHSYNIRGICKECKNA